MATATPAKKHLSQVVAIETDVRKSTERTLTGAYHALDKPALMEGMTGTYQPNSDEGDQLPDEAQRVQATVEEMIVTARGALAELFDVTAARDYSNALPDAVADVAVGDRVLVKAAPVPYLLWLDRQLDHLNAFAVRIPTHSAATEWELAEADRGIYKSKPVRTARQVQEHKVLELTKATDKHQAQVQVVPDNVIKGYWTRVRFTGAVPVSRRETILQRIKTLREAVHAARENAKRAEAAEPKLGADVMSYIFD